MYSFMRLNQNYLRCYGFSVPSNELLFTSFKSGSGFMVKASGSGK